MRHPTAGDLFELHFGEAEGGRRDAFAAHVTHCAACRALLADVEWVEAALDAEEEPAPPADGLERVLARIATAGPAARHRAGWLRATLPSAAGLVAGAAAVHAWGPPAAFAFFAVGSAVTLALAPMLILESQGRS
jgi:hypothetical protein